MAFSTLFSAGHDPFFSAVPARLMFSATALLLSLACFAADDFAYILDCGEVSDGSVPTSPAVMLIGGAEANSAGELAATQWFVDQGAGGNYLVIRTGGFGSQGLWMCDEFGEQLASVAELSIDSRAAAANPEVVAIIEQADLIFIAGGDQTEYVDFWRDTPASDAINQHMQTAPIAGTSAGMAIMGSSYYAPQTLGMFSSEILDDPFHPFTATIGHDDFLAHPSLAGAITDTHLDRTHGPDQEFRYGRVFGMLARMTDAHPHRPRNRAIGVEEAAFVAVDAGGIAKVFGAGDGETTAAYFLVQNLKKPEVLEAGTPIVWNRTQTAVKVYRIYGSPGGAGSFDLNDWINASGGEWLDWYTVGGFAGFNYALGSCKDCAGAEPPVSPDEPIFTDRFEWVH